MGGRFFVWLKKKKNFFLGPRGSRLTLLVPGYNAHGEGVVLGHHDVASKLGSATSSFLFTVVVGLEVAKKGVEEVLRLKNFATAHDVMHGESDTSEIFHAEAGRNHGQRRIFC